MKLLFISALTSVLFAAVFFAVSHAQTFGDVLTIGNSLTAGQAVSSGGVITCAALGGAVIAADRQSSCRGNGQRNVGGWQPGLANAIDTNVFNFGNSGELTSQLLSRLDSEMNVRNSQFVLILGGTNDAIRGPATSVTISNLQAMIARVRARNRTPIIGTLPPLLGGRFAGSNARIVAINAQIRQFEDVEIADHYAALVDSWSSHTSGDFIHLGPSGNAIVAQGWADAINRSIATPTQAFIPAIIILL